MEYDCSFDFDDISLCPNCGCMTHTIRGLCGKCKKPKKEV